MQTAVVSRIAWTTDILTDGIIPASEQPGARGARSSKGGTPMFGFIFGIVVGVIGKLVYDMFKDQEVPEGAADVQRRAASLLEETRQILQDVRGEIRAAADTARESASDKVGRLAQAASTAASGADGG